MFFTDGFPALFNEKVLSSAELTIPFLSLTWSCFPFLHRCPPTRCADHGRGGVWPRWCRCCCWPHRWHRAPLRVPGYAALGGPPLSDNPWTKQVTWQTLDNQHSVGHKGWLVSCWILTPHQPHRVTCEWSLKPLFINFSPGWDQVKVWILKGENSHSTCTWKPFLLPSERFLNPGMQL